jgi:hypothetical protein
MCRSDASYASQYFCTFVSIVEQHVRVVKAQLPIASAAGSSRQQSREKSFTRATSITMSHLPEEVDVAIE